MRSRTRAVRGTSPDQPPIGLVGWTLLVTVGAALGLALVVTAFVATTRLGLPAWAIYPTVALAGALLGLLVGAAQARALHGSALAVPRAAWALITMAGGLVAWSLGLVPATFAAVGEPLDLDSARVLAALTGGTIVLVVVVPAAQWLILRLVLRGAWRWVVVESVAIVVAIMVAWGASLAVEDGRPLEDVALPLLLVALGVALLFALLTGVGLLLVAPRRAWDDSRRARPFGG